MESDWVLIWLSFAARYTDSILHRQADCMLMILPQQRLRGTECSQRSLPQNVNQSSQGIPAGVAQWEGGFRSHSCYRGKA